MSTKTTAPTSKATESGVIRFDGSLITYTSQHYGSFSIPLSEAAVIGEFTTDNGPFIDDWFLVFVPLSGDDWFEASMSAEGIQSVRDQLATVLGVSFDGCLVYSTDTI